MDSKVFIFKHRYAHVKWDVQCDVGVKIGISFLMKFHEKLDETDNKVSTSE